MVTRLAYGGASSRLPFPGGYGDWAGQERSGSVVQVGGDGGGDGEGDHLPASRGSSSRLRTATAHRTLRCSGPTVRVTAADLSLGSANPWPFSDPGLAGRQAGTVGRFREAG